MKYLLLSLVTLLPLLVQGQTWTWINVPQAGANAEIQVDGVPAGESSYHLVMYSYEGTKLTATDVTLLSGDMSGEYKAQVPVPAKSSWIALQLKDEAGEMITGTTEKVINEGAKAEAASVEEALSKALYYRVIGIDKDEMEANVLFRDAVITDPAWLDQPDVMARYYQVAKSLNAQSDLDVIKEHISSISKNPKKSSEAMLVQATRSAQMMNDTVLRLSLRKRADKLFPKNLLAQEDALMEFKKTTTLDQKIKLQQQFKTRFGITDENRGLFDQMTGTIADEYAAVGDWDKVQLYVNQMANPMARASAANSYAWSLSGESTEKEGSHYDIAEKLSAASIQCIDAKPTKPTYLSPNEWAQNLENMKAQYGDTYALVLYKLGRYAEAASQQLVAVKNANYEDAEMNERYAVYLEKAGKNKELSAFMDQVMVTGKATARVKDIHKNYWTKIATQDQLYAQYVTQIEQKAHDLIEDKIKGMWQDEVPAAFTLKDLQGNAISLDDYKGKTVVIDFWATWCGPCKASFPGMKKTVEHYASDKDVVFLFVDTWENQENLEPRVSGFIRDNSYPFHVLLDNENSVVTHYKVDGIPTKFIIGPDQKIRFISVGYSGNTDELVEEMKIMIEMAKSGGILRS